eukprot:gnl/TRDRNA2_/TRDRNA2_56645_c0_seq1.p1 gnl/TRDRNA2_/TRDRNA2_56645_c0~~gnl/TRDRNA2_/TRDRNA2_56645_c0_seq1.p1  ORF type:complete len:270 (-),score=27.81 gnl/TRDRNA2_/TRDRNA2_56645_c0_seq1:95-904(-)
MLHSACAAFSGILALVYPPFFGSVFPSMSSSQTLDFISRVYYVLFATQAWLLVAFRKVSDEAWFRQVSTVYCCVFATNIAIALNAEFVQNIVQPHVLFSPLWLAFAVAYGFVARTGTYGMFCILSQVHSVIAGCVGVSGILSPAMLNTAAFLTPYPATAYATLSRYYGALIIGMSFLTFRLTKSDAAPAWSMTRPALGSMFAATGFFYGMAIYNGEAKGDNLADHPLASMVSISSIGLFAVMSILYATSSMPDKFDASYCSEYKVGLTE